MVQVRSLLGLFAYQFLGTATALPEDDAQHIISSQEHYAKDVYAVRDG